MWKNYWHEDGQFVSELQHNYAHNNVSNELTKSPRDNFQSEGCNQTLNFFMKRTSPILAIAVIILLYIRPVLRPNESHKNPKTTLLAKKIGRAHV